MFYHAILETKDCLDNLLLLLLATKSQQYRLNISRQIKNIIALVIRL